MILAYRKGHMGNHLILILVYDRYNEEISMLIVVHKVKGSDENLDHGLKFIVRLWVMIV